MQALLGQYVPVPALFLFIPFPQVPLPIEGSSAIGTVITRPQAELHASFSKVYIFMIWFEFFLPVKDCYKHWAFKLKGVNESVPVITITGSLVHSTVALRWFLIISKPILKACSCCYSPPVHHRKCGFAAQCGRKKKEKKKTVLLQLWHGCFF